MPLKPTRRGDIKTENGAELFAIYAFCKNSVMYMSPALDSYTRKYGYSKIMDIITDFVVDQNKIDCWSIT